MIEEDDDTQVYKDHGDALTIAYQSGYYDGKKAAQRPWVGLTDEEQSFVYDKIQEKPRNKPFWVAFACAIEAKLKEKQ